MHWGYEGAEGPAMWARLDGKWAACDGAGQSPVDLEDAVAGPVPPLEPQYQAAHGTLVDNGHTIVLELEGAGGMVLDGTRYTLAQLHFHHPSEHTVGGEAQPLEMHLVHKAADGSLAVVGVWFREGAANPALAAVLAALPAPGERKPLDGTFSAASFVAAGAPSYRYEGSLTTPPCSTGVRWIVLREPTTISPEQLAAFASRYVHDARPTQPLGDRQITIDVTAR